MFVIVLFDSGMFYLHNLLTLQPMNQQGKVGSEKIHGFHAGPGNHGDNTIKPKSPAKENNQTSLTQRKDCEIKVLELFFSN